MLQEEEPNMPTLQETHRMTAASPASTATFWVLRQELAYRHFYGTDRMHIGKEFLTTVDEQLLREDNMSSSGTLGITGFGESFLCPGEAQGRGFEHGHDKKTSIPKGHLIQYQDFKSVCMLAGKQAIPLEQVNTPDRDESSPNDSGVMPPSMQHPSRASASSDAPPLANTEAQMLSAMDTYNEDLITYVTSRQHESSILPGTQFGLDLPEFRHFPRDSSNRADTMDNTKPITPLREIWCPSSRKTPARILPEKQEERQLNREH